MKFIKNKKVIFLFIAIIIIVILSIFAFNLYNGKKEEEKVINLDFETKKKKIENMMDIENTRMENVDKTVLKDKFGIDENCVLEVIGKLPILNVKSNMYIVVKVTPDQKENVKQKFEEYGLNMEKEWENYLSDEYTKVKERKIGIVGDYVYFIVSSNKDMIVDLLK